MGRAFSLPYIETNDATSFDGMTFPFRYSRTLAVTVIAPAGTLDLLVPMFLSLRGESRSFRK